MIQELLKKANDLPHKPGVYQMIDKAGTVIYVGKAKSLKNRVSSYFSGAHDDKTTRMVSKVVQFHIILCATEFDALVLECALIKEKAPRYNILLKDDKAYPFIRLDRKKPYPRFAIVAKKAEDGASYFGPYGGRHITREVIRTLSQALQLASCNRRFPQDIGKERPCLNHHVGLCLAYCRKDTPKAEYDERLRQAVMVLEGKTETLTSTLTEEMHAAAEQMRFEQAASIRDRIRALESLDEKQSVVSVQMADTDMVGYYRGAAKSAFVVMHYIGGKLLDKSYEIIETPLETEAEAVSALLKQYYQSAARYPRYLYLPCAIEDRAAMETFLTECAGSRVRIEVPQRGEKRKQVEIANENAKIEAGRASTKEERVRGILQWLEKALDLPKAPMRIEAFDISNFGASDVVAAMTVFENAKPLKRDYRKFQIKTVDGQDDYHSMEEVLTRRFRRYLEGDASFLNLPDLLLIDGGQTHAKVAEKVLRQLGLTIPIFGMVKDERHRTRALIGADGSEIGMGAVPQVFSFIGTIQEETHRFAINYQRSLRSKHYGSALDTIEGIGETRRNKLLQHFKTVKNIKAATLEELSKVVPKKTAEAIIAHFSEEKGEHK